MEKQIGKGDDEMAMPKGKEPIYDKKVQQVLDGLADGKPRDELAGELGYTNPRSLDTYMRRKHFAWDAGMGNYVPEAGRDSGTHSPAPLTLAPSKAATVVKMFDRGDADAKSIAGQLGFADHRELAGYMKGKGYAWDAGRINYVKQAGRASGPPKAGVGNECPVEERFASETVQSAGVVPGDMASYLPLLQLLEQNRDRLVELLATERNGEIPRFAVPGIPVTKSVHMMNNLDQMVRDFSREKNISQRDLFEVALIEFFRRYGYEREVGNLLSQS